MEREKLTVIEGLETVTHSGLEATPANEKVYAGQTLIAPLYDGHAAAGRPIRAVQTAINMPILTGNSSFTVG